jgi:hypothetical protein
MPALDLHTDAPADKVNAASRGQADLVPEGNPGVLEAVHDQTVEIIFTGLNGKAERA